MNIGMSLAMRVFPAQSLGFFISFMLLLPKTVVLVFLSGCASAQTVEVKENLANPGFEFLRALEGTWDMKGKFKPFEQGEWIPTGSKMVATLQLNERALMRDITAEQINFEARDVIWFDDVNDEFTYIYLNSLSSVPVIMKGTLTDSNEVTFNGIDSDVTTVIRLNEKNQMTAQDFWPKSSGDGKWMKRNVSHTRVAKALTK